MKRELVDDHGARGRRLDPVEHLEILPAQRLRLLVAEVGEASIAAERLLDLEQDRLLLEHVELLHVHEQGV